MKSATAIVLAAGKGTRIKAEETNKVLLPLANKPMVSYIIDLLKSLHIEPVIVVIGYQKEKVKQIIKNNVLFITQRHLLGTGHAVKCALSKIPKDKSNVLILYGDHSSFYQPFMIKKIINQHQIAKADITFVSVDKKNPTGYGRIIRDGKGKILAIKEEKNTAAQEKKIKEINAGAYCCSLTFLENYIPKIKKDPVSEEYYLTDLVSLAIAERRKVNVVKLKDEVISVGINTREELKIADQLMRQRIKT